MILQKKTINNVPTLVPLTADTGSGVPVGTIIGQYKKVNMAGYLYLDGSTFDQTLYPALYAYLGTNVLPDYREFVLVGAEQNTTSATIADHDVFTQGQEKDDTLQSHNHQDYLLTINSQWTLINNAYTGSYTGFAVTSNEAVSNDKSPIAYVTNSNGRYDSVTRTKEKAVFWYIKATTGIIESEATEMLNVINENNSYSTSEINTGKKWIDGKPIYRKVVTGIGSFDNLHWEYITVDTSAVIKTVRHYEIICPSVVLRINDFTFTTTLGFSTVADSGNGSAITDADFVLTLEYTKTTD